MGFDPELPLLLVLPPPLEEEEGRAEDELDPEGLPEDEEEGLAAEDEDEEGGAADKDDEEEGMIEKGSAPRVLMKPRKARMRRMTASGWSQGLGPATAGVRNVILGCFTCCTGG